MVAAMWAEIEIKTGCAVALGADRGAERHDEAAVQTSARQENTQT